MGDVCAVDTHHRCGRLRSLSPGAGVAAGNLRQIAAGTGPASPSCWSSSTALLQLHTWRNLYPGLMHAMIFWGFIVLTIATTVVMIDYDFGIPIMRGYFYLVFQSFLTDVFGGLAMLGIGMAAGRRLIARPKRSFTPNARSS